MWSADEWEQGTGHAGAGRCRYPRPCRPTVGPPGCPTQRAICRQGSKQRDWKGRTTRLSTWRCQPYLSWSRYLLLIVVNGTLVIRAPSMKRLLIVSSPEPGSSHSGLEKSKLFESCLARLRGASFPGGRTASRHSALQFHRVEQPRSLPSLEVSCGACSSSLRRGSRRCVLLHEIVALCGLRRPFRQKISSRFKLDHFATGSPSRAPELTTAASHPTPPLPSPHLQLFLFPCAPPPVQLRPSYIYESARPRAVVKMVTLDILLIQPPMLALFGYCCRMSGCTSLREATCIFR